MEAQSISLIEIEKAWHLFSLLLRLGHPARPTELAARCMLFRASPDLVQFLCSIPDSPLLLTGDLFVSISWQVVLSAFSDFASKAISSFVPRIRARISWPKRHWDDSVLTYARKRKGERFSPQLLPTAKRRLLSHPEIDREGSRLLSSTRRVQIASTKANVDVGEKLSRDVGLLSFDFSVKEHASGIFVQQGPIQSFILAANSMESSFTLEDIVHKKGPNAIDMGKISMLTESSEHLHLAKHQHGFLNFEIDLNQNAMPSENAVESEPYVEPDLLKSMTQKPMLGNEIQMDRSYCQTTGQALIRNEPSSTMTNCFDAYNQYGGLVTKEEGVSDSLYCHDTQNKIMDNTKTTVFHCQIEQDFLDAGTSRRDPKNCAPSVDTAEIVKTFEKALADQIKWTDTMTTLYTDQRAAEVELPVNTAPVEPSIAQKSPRNASSRKKTLYKDLSSLELQAVLEPLDDNKLINPSKQQEKERKYEQLTFKKQNSKRGRNLNIPTKENRVDPSPKANKNLLEQKTVPNFECYIVEEEEGSGGYGTVYRARRRKDGKTFAIKCPHANAHAHHVNNELKMLERFGGRNYVIKYEGSFKSGNSDCFVLEHVEHDRPEVLKREIDVYELQWYGYCLFRALASLHKQGIVHRDVKPGNFLFSRKWVKGYLIDFNLAMDLNQKYGTNSNSKIDSNGSLDHAPCSKGYPSSKEAIKAGHGRVIEAIHTEASKDSLLETKNVKKKVNGVLKTFKDVGSRITNRSQGADVSGVNSTKDVTSARTPSAERLRQPMPSQGRKALINYLQETIQSPKQESFNAPASQRKRVAAPSGKVERRLLHFSPMPGAGLLKGKGDRKHRREGPCVGTKGFRAPEVLFKSPHQGPKVDIWSAGVTLLYLMIGRTPFVGDPEQNIKDIAKLRGSEDLWEVAKLHNRESSFPEDLFDIHSLPSKDLREWCEENTRRSKFHEMAPRSLFDLIDKCLTVNPRPRISAEEALRHEFFAPCHEVLRKQRLLRQQSLTSESCNQSL